MVADYTSKATGDWDTAGQATWNEVGIPGTGDTVEINDGHVVRIDNGTGDEMAESVTIKDGGELIIDTEGAGDRKLTFGGGATLDVQDGGTLSLEGTATDEAIIDFDEIASTITLAGTVDADYAELKDVNLDALGYINVAGGTIDFLSLAINTKGDLRYYFKGKASTFAIYKCNFTGLYYAIQNATYDFVFTQDPRQPEEVKGTVYVEQEVLGRAQSIVKVTGQMAERLGLSGLFTGVSNQYKVAELKKMRDSLESFTYTSPKHAIGTARIVDVIGAEPAGYLTTYPYELELIQDE
ncbi:hypothetical protein KAR91_05335 [Candidatus Pacearchaeota archaeon]|nr:hypothetical protein [Candidatus Pacearchaeota archaeon]